MKSVLAFIINWLRGFVYIADGLIILLSLGMIEPEFSLHMEAWFLYYLEKELHR